MPVKSRQGGVNRKQAGTTLRGRGVYCCIEGRQEQAEGHNPEAFFYCPN